MPFSNAKDPCAGIYMIQFGLFPQIRERLVKRTKEGGEGGGFFMIGTDSSYIKHLGVQKHVDLNVRYWNEGIGQVEDAFLHLHVVGHEPAALQVANIMKTFTDLGIPVVKMISISRDNPTVMKAVFRLLRDKVTEVGNPALMDLICYFHPTHTVFEKCCKALTADLVEDDINIDDEDDVGHSRGAYLPYLGVCTDGLSVCLLGKRIKN